MQSNTTLISTFFKAFQNKDYKTMQNCYAENALFSDEVFINLNVLEVRAMWEMFCRNGKDLQIEFSKIQADDDMVSTEWTATYTFSKTNRKVVNHIKSKFNLADGKIISHTDHFNFYNWASQALGLPGILLGWTPLLKNKIRRDAFNSLLKYIKNSV